MVKGNETTKDVEVSEPKVERLPAKSAQAREDQLIAMAYNRVEERIRNNEATGPELVHFLKLGSTKGRLEKDILEKERELVTAKTEALRAQRQVEELYAQAIEAMKSYGGGNNAE